MTVGHQGRARVARSPSGVARPRAEREGRAPVLRGSPRRAARATDRIRRPRRPASLSVACSRGVALVVAPRRRPPLSRLGDSHWPPLRGLALLLSRFPRPSRGRPSVNAGREPLRELGGTRDVAERARSSERLPTQRKEVTRREENECGSSAPWERTVNGEKKNWWTNLGVAFLNRGRLFSTSGSTTCRHASPKPPSSCASSTRRRPRRRARSSARAPTPGPPQGASARGGEITPPLASLLEDVMRDDELHRFKSDIPLSAVRGRSVRLRARPTRGAASRAMCCANLRQPATDDKIVVRKDRDGHWTAHFSIRDDRDHGTIVDFVQRARPAPLARARP